MGTCFVIQPFDGGKYDKRYKDTFKPAIEKCGLVAYRVDEDPKTQIPIDDIDLRIREAEICLADITENNPNVWFELGLAIAYKKKVILLCSSERGEKKHPFDIQHRSVISYTCESASDFDKLRQKIEAVILAHAKREKNSGQKIEEKIQAVIQLNGAKTIASNNISETSELTSVLEQHEIAILIAIASNIDNPDKSVAVYKFKGELESSGYTKLEITLGFKKLSIIEFIELSPEYDYNDNEYTAYKITDKGMKWLIGNKSKVVIKESADTSTVENSRAFMDDVPF